MANKAPHFACISYPNCPDREESTKVQIDEGDTEEGFAPMCRFDFAPVSGPCTEHCHLRKMEEPINHSVVAIIGGRVVDIGS